MCIATTEKGTQCSRRCAQGSDMCKFHTKKYEESTRMMDVWATMLLEIRSIRWRPVEYRNAARFKGCVDNARNREMVRRRVEARLLEIGKRVAARRIANTWRRVSADPNYRVCRDRLTREFSDMNEF